MQTITNTRLGKNSSVNLKTKINITVMPLRYWWKSQKSNKKSKKTDRETTFGRFPDVLAEVLFPLITSKKIKSIRATVSESHKVAPEEKRVPGRVTEISSIYNIYRPKIWKKNPFVK